MDIRRIYASEPLTIRVIATENTESMDDPLGQGTIAAFKTQCQRCHRLLAGWDRRYDRFVLPSVDAIRSAAVVLLERHGCVLDGEVTCSSCASDGADTRSDALLLTEAVLLAPRSDWLEWPGNDA